jgi:hypothetical protein
VPFPDSWNHDWHLLVLRDCGVLKVWISEKGGKTCDQTQLAWTSDQFHSHAVMSTHRIGCGQPHF